MSGFLRIRLHSRLRHAVLSALLLGAFGLPATADDLTTGFHERVYRDETGEHKYVIFLPAQYSPDLQWPVILYLHGASARGTDNRLQIIDGLAPHVRARANSFPFVVVFPQCEDRIARNTDGWRATSPDAKRALRMLDEVERDYNIDRRREIVTGPSMGGVGSWDLAAANPTRFAGILVASGMANPAEAAKLKDVSVWVCHGDKDQAMPIDSDRKMVEAINAAGGHATLTVLPGAKHVIAHVVYSDDDVYSWMLDPKSEPRQEQLLANSDRQPTPEELGFDINTAFVPAAEIPQAVYVRLGKDALESLTSTLPEMLPQSALSGAVGGNQHAAHSGFMTLQMNVSGMSYHGQLDRVTIDCRNDGWMILHLGLRNMTLEVQQSQLNGTFVSATAGPMYVMIGQKRPVWLSVPLKPYVESGRLRFETNTPEFSIPADDFHVTTPSVEAHGLPIIKRGVSSRFQEQLVSGAYERKPEIERMVIASAPKLVNRLEARLDQEFEKQRVIGGWPMPALQPRYMLWANDVRVEENGIAMILGMTISRPGLNPPECAIRRIQGKPLSFDDIPKSPGFQIGISGGMLGGITSAMIAADAATSDLLDLNAVGFAPFRDRRQMCQLIPDLERYGEQLQVRTLTTLLEPVDMMNPDEGGKSLQAVTSWEHESHVSNQFAFAMPKVRLTVEIKTSPDQEKWQPCAQADVNLRQALKMHLVKPGFDQRMIDVEATDKAQASAVARFADGYQPQNATLRADEFASLFAKGWQSGGQMQLMREMGAKDMHMGNTTFRVSDVGWLEPFCVKFLEPAHTRITNSTPDAVDYYTRVAASDWGGPYHLTPGKSHEFNVPYPLIVYYRTRDGVFTRTVPLGTQCELSVTPSSADAPLMQTEVPSGLERQ
jgi:poly(3-hydroxybutyrate) depolymerase